ncbi:hypothetical protein [Microcystis phage Mel-JY01]
MNTEEIDFKFNIEPVSPTRHTVLVTGYGYTRRLVELNDVAAYNLRRSVTYIILNKTRTFSALRLLRNIRLKEMYMYHNETRLVGAFEGHIYAHEDGETNGDECGITVFSFNIVVHDVIRQDLTIEYAFTVDTKFLRTATRRKVDRYIDVHDVKI